MEAGCRKARLGVEMGAGKRCLEWSRVPESDAWSGAGCRKARLGVEAGYRKARLGMEAGTGKRGLEWRKCAGKRGLECGREGGTEKELDIELGIIERGNWVTAVWLLGDRSVVIG